MTALKQKSGETQSPLDILQAKMAVDMKAVNAMILDNMQSEVPLIPHLASYLIAAGGKRIRPLLTLSCTALFDGDMTRAHRLAAAVEFIHTATLLHDDVVDDSEERRGKKSANVVFGNEASVLVGDFLFSRAFQLMVADGNLDVLRILSTASAIIAEGEVLQLSVQNNLDTSMDDYLRVIEGKTASLFAAACEVGPVIAGQNAETVQAIRDYGMNLGLAFQIIDDVLDYNAEREKLGKTVGDDFREGKMTAPVLFAIQKANKEELEFWARTLGDKNQQDGDLETAQTLIAKYDAISQGMKLAQEYGDKAIQNLNSLPDRELKSTLQDLISFTINRQY
ncbi:MAG TPA: polyprenyl synthetase family protein [Alphaproteobacteria bacterium]|nr:polyprenyl synthetase family protein [Alphaproteobacteria bacterium]